ncbi:MAG: GatB/YqeY domain-containing protein [Bosea sp. (in: a-proteobacteria)]|uniref:GatB/YqeY domain-containing protein n=1 Tax=unclassified Bosea (in: a-proteobacteria) TaxID=2653178 RepID=UPI000960E7E9|nr:MULTISPECIES: GatB/YqeY domain-containing protein [unclassified Bosea (in: a-proteobacteria)]MBN9442518.1 GatB/YqeY domain-containing protein [Bosea sp. (in: a-proteobacteria)]MBN9456001.1 GatB/YqeY domain-containing protein [Bosea sp. (in: a-proteobacteria)]OJV05847.1 MAG: glutamyl-tRNA amidotransferase [Bosea sp. 67-29]
MTSLRERFTADMKEAMKAGEKAKVAAIRLISAALKEKDIEARGAGKGEATPDEILGVLQKMIKQRQESIAIYDANGRPELAEGERAEVAVIASYLPKQMSEEEVKAAIAKAIAETGATAVKDMGKVIGVLRAAYAGQMDFGKASPMVKAALGG